jgi:hypothetical protein
MKPVLTAISIPCLIALLLVGCANVADDKNKVAASSAPTQPESASEPAAKEAPSAEVPARPEPVLRGKTYRRTTTPPRTIEKDWTRAITLDLGPKVPEDFLLLTSKDRRLAVVAVMGKHLHGTTYEYTVSDELLLPDAIFGYALARCSQQPHGRRSVLAAMIDGVPRLPVWAIKVSDGGMITTLNPTEISTLQCSEKPKRL